MKHDTLFMQFKKALLTFHIFRTLHFKYIYTIYVYLNNISYICTMY